MALVRQDLTFSLDKCWVGVVQWVGELMVCDSAWPALLTSAGAGTAGSARWLPSVAAIGCLAYVAPRDRPEGRRCPFPPVGGSSTWRVQSGASVRPPAGGLAECRTGGLRGTRRVLARPRSLRRSVRGTVRGALRVAMCVLLNP